MLYLILPLLLTQTDGRADWVRFGTSTPEPIQAFQSKSTPQDRIAQIFERRIAACKASKTPSNRRGVLSYAAALEQAKADKKDIVVVFGPRSDSFWAELKETTDTNESLLAEAGKNDGFEPGVYTLSWADDRLVIAIAKPDKPSKPQIPQTQVADPDESSYTPATVMPTMAGGTCLR